MRIIKMFPERNRKRSKKTDDRQTSKLDYNQVGWLNGSFIFQI